MYMKTTYRDLRIQGLLVIAVWLLLVNTGCQKATDATVASDQNASNAQTKYSFGNFAQVNLNANTQGYHAPHINPKLHNAWGMSASPGGTFWISAADGGVTFIYNNKGVQQLPAVAIPSHIAGAPGN